MFARPVDYINYKLTNSYHKATIPSISRLILCTTSYAHPFFDLWSFVYLQNVFHS